MSSVDDKKLPTLATLKKHGHYLNGFLWRQEQNRIQSEVRICNGDTHHLLRKKVYTELLWLRCHMTSMTCCYGNNMVIHSNLKKETHPGGSARLF